MARKKTAIDALMGDGGYEIAPIESAVKFSKKRGGKHLTVNADGSLTWDWDKLLEEVRAATGIINVTEVKIKKTRKKKEV